MHCTHYHKLSLCYECRDFCSINAVSRANREFEIEAATENNPWEFYEVLLTSYCGEMDILWVLRLPMCHGVAQMKTHGFPRNNTWVFVRITPWETLEVLPL